MRLHNVLLIVLLTGCAQQNTSSPSGASQPSTAVQLCGLDVGFSAVPRRMTQDEIKSVSSSISSSYAKWEMTGWVADKYRLTENAVCVCRDFQFSNDEFQRIISTIRSQPYGATAKEVNIAGIGPTVQFESLSTSPMAKERVQMTHLADSPSCLLLQSTILPEAESQRSQFFYNLSPIAPKKTSAAAATPAERLRVLESLKADGLITADEYNTRKKVILDSL